METIDVIIACGVNSEKYCEFLIRSIEKTCSGKYFFNFLLGVNDRGVDFSSLEQIETKFDISVYDCITEGVGSAGHGAALDLLFPYISSEFAMTCDVDTVALAQNWDDIVIQKMLDSDASIIGAEYDGHKYMNFPNLMFCVFDTEVFRKCNVSFMPALKNIVIDENNAEIYSRAIGDVIFLDTGWQICYNLKTQGYSGICLPLKSPRHNDTCTFMTSDMRGEEYVLGDIPIFYHIGRSSSRSFDNPITIKWRNRTIEYLGLMDEN